MAFTSNRSVIANWVNGAGTTVANTIAAAANLTAPGQEEIRTISIGNATITPPNVVGFVPTACTIVPPTGYAGTITLKGIAGDTGILLHPTDPTSIGIGNAANTFVLTIAVANCIGLRLIWT